MTQVCVSVVSQKSPGQQSSFFVHLPPWGTLPAPTSPTPHFGAGASSEPQEEARATASQKTRAFFRMPRRQRKGRAANKLLFSRRRCDVEDLGPWDGLMGPAADVAAGQRRRAQDRGALLVLPRVSA